MLDSQVHGRCGDRDKKDQMMYLLYHGIKKVDVVEEKVEELELNVGMVETGGGVVVCTDGEEVQTCRNQIAQLNALIAEVEAFDDPGEVFDMLMGLRDDVRVENVKLMGLNKLVA
ncbi:hypothetical protein Tco_0001707 [Tanacetum coccineum]